MSNLVEVEIEVEVEVRFCSNVNSCTKNYTSGNVSCDVFTLSLAFANWSCKVRKICFKRFV